MYFNAENINLFTSKKCKKVFLGIFFLSSLGSLPSCRLPLNETPPPPSEIVVGMGDSNDCISRVNPTIQSFFKGEAADVQIQASFDCVSNALDTFEKSVKGQYPDRYTGREIAHFIEQYYLEPGHAFSDELMLRFFKIKQVFAGGNQTSISRQELKVLRDLMKRVRDLAIDMNTYMPLYSMSWNGAGVSDLEIRTRLAEAEIHLLDFQKRFSQFFIEPLDLQDLIFLAQELEKVFPPQSADKNSWVNLSNRYVPLMISIKQIILSDKNSVIGKVSRSQIFDFIQGVSASQSMEKILRIVSRGYMRYLNFHYQFDQNKIEESSVINNIEKWTGDTFDLFVEILKGKNSNQISWEELDTLSDSLIGSQILPELMTAKTLKQTLRLLLNEFLMLPSQRLSSVQRGGLDIESVEILKSELGQWIQAQKFIENTYSAPGSSNEFLQSEILSKLDQSAPSIPILELKIAFRGPMTMAMNSSDFIAMTSPEVRYSKRSATYLNTVRWGSRWLIRSFAKDLNRISNYQGLSEAEVSELYQKLHPLLSELKFVHPKNDSFGINRFRDAGLFTDVSDGDDWANFGEMSRLFMMIVSGLNMHSLIFDPIEANQSCSLDKHSSVYNDDWTVDYSCLEEVYYQNSQFFSGVPDFTSELSKLDRNQFKGVFKNLLIAAGYKESSGSALKVGDLALVPHTIQYIEAFFKVFDTEHEIEREGVDLLNPPTREVEPIDGRIDYIEANQSYPRFKTILKKVSGLSDDGDLRGLLHWMLRYGKPPESIPDKIKFKGWWLKLKEKDRGVNADRAQLASILAYISKALAAAAKSTEVSIEGSSSVGGGGAAISGAGAP